MSGGVLAWLSVWIEVQTYTAQLMPLPLTVSCFSKIQIGFAFLVPAHLGSPGKRAVKRVCVCGSMAVDDDQSNISLVFRSRKGRHRDNQFFVSIQRTELR